MGDIRDIIVRRTVVCLRHMGPYPGLRTFSGLIFGRPLQL